MWKIVNITNGQNLYIIYAKKESRNLAYNILKKIQKEELEILLAMDSYEEVQSSSSSAVSEYESVLFEESEEYE